MSNRNIQQRNSSGSNIVVSGSGNVVSGGNLSSSQPTPHTSNILQENSTGDNIVVSGETPARIKDPLALDRLAAALKDYEAAQAAYIAPDFISRSLEEMTQLRDAYDQGAHRVAGVAFLVIALIEDAKRGKRP